MASDERQALEDLLYRRQFVLGPSCLPQVAAWPRLQIAGRICVIAHPDLNAQQVTRQEISLTLLGFLIDPYEPQSSNAAILDRLLHAIERPFNFGRWVSHTESLGGRWILIVHDGRTTTLFTDPMGLRQVFYTDRSLTGGVWCATQPGLVADALGLGMDPVAISQFLMSEPVRRWQEFLWPADTCSYREFRRLLPNRSLDLDTGECTRFWPTGPLEHRSLQEGVEATIELLPKLLLACSVRFKLAHAVSAGWDSRLLLAASKEVCRDVWYYTYARKGADADVTVIPRLLERLGLTDHLLPLPDRGDKAFADLFRRHVSLSRPFCGRFIQALLDSCPQDRVCIAGNAAEITRVRFRRHPASKSLARSGATNSCPSRPGINYRRFHSWIRRGSGGLPTLGRRTTLIRLTSSTGTTGRGTSPA